MLLSHIVKVLNEQDNELVRVYLALPEGDTRAQVAAIHDRITELVIELERDGFVRNAA